jgi:DNA-binding MarR family transcriptional regulator
MTGRIRDEELSRYGVTLMQASVLYMVKALGDNATPRNLSRWLFREPPTISDGLARMEKQGLIKKIPMNYRGQIRVVLTEAGERAYQNSTLRTSILNIMTRVPPEKLLQLKSLLQEIRAAVMIYMGLAPQSSHLPEEIEGEGGMSGEGAKYFLEEETVEATSTRRRLKHSGSRKAVEVMGRGGRR